MVKTQASRNQKKIWKERWQVEKIDMTRYESMLLEEVQLYFSLGFV
jgi:hypothetical protein